MRELKTLDDFRNFIKENPLVIIDFTATWCGPCKVIGPKFEALSSEYQNVEFVKIDVDENADAAEACEINAMPTFQLYKNGQKVGEFVGANIDGVKKLINDNL